MGQAKARGTFEERQAAAVAKAQAAQAAEARAASERAAAERAERERLAANRPRASSVVIGGGVRSRSALRTTSLLAATLAAGILPATR